jgi:hypothetical protein
MIDQTPIDLLADDVGIPGGKPGDISLSAVIGKFRAHGLRIALLPDRRGGP